MIVNPVLFSNIIKSAICYFNGGISEKLTIKSGSTTVIEVTTNGHGTLDEPIELEMGTYTVTGSLSGYTRNVEVTGDGSYNAYPDGAIFWYGNGDTSGDTLYSKLGGWITVHGAYPDGFNGSGASSESKASATTNTNDRYTWASNTGSSTKYGATSISVNAINYAGYSTLNIIMTGKKDSYNGGKSVVGTCASAVSSAGAFTLQCGGASISDCSYALSGSSGYFVASAFNAHKKKDYTGIWYTYYANNTVSAVYLT